MLFIALLLNNGKVKAQVAPPAPYNINAKISYVRTWNALAPDTDRAHLITRPVAEVNQSTEYFDGLGRSIQTVQKQVSPAGKDMISARVYDNCGREQYKYLPFVSNTSPSSDDNAADGNLKLDPFQQQAAFSSSQYPGETYYYGQTVFENSLLYRPTNTYAPGNNWVGSSRGVGNQYLVNQISDSVYLWTIASAAGSVPITSARYPAGTLYKNISIDEANHTVIEYKDMQDKVILKKVQLAVSPGTGHVGWLSTYYIYDDLNNLRFVIQPRAIDLLEANGTWNLGSLTNLTTELCFRYEYDYRKRMIVKLIPGAGEIWMVYDGRDRLVMTQDANLRAIGKWMVIKYDTEDRPDTTGLLTDANNRSYHQNLSENNSYYPNTSVNFELLGQTYYDGYLWTSGLGLVNSLNTTYTTNASYFNTSYNSSPLYAQSITQYPISRGSQTGSQTKVIGTSSQFLATVNFYDDRGRMIESQNINQTGGKDTLISQYDFSGRILRNLVCHQKSGLAGNIQTHSVLTKYSYDAMGRTLTINKNVDNAVSDQLILTNTYNELGQLQNKQLGNNLDNIAYGYNIRGWLLTINKPFITGTANPNNNYFGMELAYDKQVCANSSTTYSNQQFNGNIAGTLWKSNGDGVGRKYDFNYDNANRLIGADFNQFSGSAFDKTAGIDFSVSNLTYDGNGNILSMNQTGFKVGGSTLIDQLTYTYQLNSNKLAQVNDAVNDALSKLGDFHYTGTKGSSDYTYDGNGNLITDNNKLIDKISYNYLNLPVLVHPNTKGNIQYVYDAAGNKLQKITTDSTNRHITTTLYVTGFTYQQTDSITTPNAGKDTLQIIGHEEGRIRWAYHKYTSGSSAYGFEYDFFERDHLGNIRMVLTQQKDTAKYLASGEAAYRATESQLFANLTTTTISRIAVSNYPANTTITNPNDTVFKVNGTVGGHKTGPSLLLKVMSGDKIDIAVQSFYNSGTTSTPNSSVTDVLASLASGIVNMASGGKGSLTDLNNTTTSPIYGALNSFMSNDPNPTGKPKAYLNWILLDDQLKYVSSYPQSGAVVVGAPGTLNVLGYTGIPITKNGYLYIWVSNETPNWDVFFDNLAVTHYPGPELEENHYYAFGLTMAGISSKALKPNYVENKYRYNDGTELANKEFSDGSGLEMYETDFRGYDPQIGRFWQIDPFGEIFEEWSPYTFGFDNPVVFNDPLGLSADSTSSKSNHHSRHHHHKPKYKELAPVTVVGYKKDCKTCGKPSPTVKVGPAPNKPQPLNYINWPNSTPEERAVWKTNQSLYFDRVHSGALLIQGGETQQYLNSLAMYQQWTQADQDYKTMQIAAVGIIFGPWTLAEVGVAASYVNYAELADQAYFYTELGYNVLIRDLILSFRQGMAGRLSIDQLIRLEKLANQYRGLNKVLTPKNIERVLKEINKVLKH